MNSQIVQNNVFTTKQTIERFCRVFSPSNLDRVEEIEKQLSGLSTFELQERLYKQFIEPRFIRLKDQQNVYFPSQRSQEWFAQRAKVKSSITGSRPAGWYFNLKTEATYTEELAYVHLGKKKVFDEATLKRMRWGVQFEDDAALRFIEFGLKKQLDVFIYETGFVRNSNPALSYLGASPDGIVGITVTGTVLAERRTNQGTLELLMTYYDICGDVQSAVVSGKEKIEAGFKHIARGSYRACSTPFDDNVWQKSEHEGKRISKMIHAALEIKCPQKMYSNVPLYYFAQLHCEMHCFNLKHAFFVTWHVKNGIERTRVWRVKYNAAFFEMFSNDICELFRMKRADNVRGTQWPTFKQAWIDFKRSFGTVKAWKPYVTPLFEPRKFSLEKKYVEKKSTKE